MPSWMKTAAEVQSEQLERAKSRVRKQRDTLLKETDWTQVADAPVDQQAYKDYRAALRDVPQQGGFPDNVTWPVHPG